MLVDPAVFMNSEVNFVLSRFETSNFSENGTLSGFDICHIWKGFKIWYLYRFQRIFSIFSILKKFSNR